MAEVRSTELRRDAEGLVRHGAEWLLLWADPDAIRSVEARARAVEDGRRAAAAERALAAALRAVAARPVPVGFAGDDEGALEPARARLPALPRPPGAAALAVVRGAADALAARLRHHDPVLHRALAPAAPEAAALFAAAEQARCEALAGRHRPGVLANLAAATAARLERLGFAHARLAGDMPPEEALGPLLRRRFAAGGADLVPLGLRMWDGFVGARLGADAAAMATAINDQTRFAAAAHRFVAAFLAELGRASTTPPAPHDAAAPGDGAAERREPRTPNPEEPDAAPAPDAGAAPIPPLPAAAASPAYAPYSTRHDRVLRAGDICDAAELARLRAAFDAETGAVRSLLTRLAAQLQRRLLAQQRRAWEFDLEEGLLDAGKLARVVVTPDAPLSFKQDRDAAFRDTVVALLIDCSGSMRGRPIRLAAIAADITARALERGGVRCEVLGFTTADFTGGRHAQAWFAAGRPPAPGRLGDLRHVVIKPADAPYRAARTNFGLLLKPDLLRENVDGEALAWAHGRLLARRERRRVLVVISDGAPSETLTLQANPPGLLEQHLAETVAAIEAAGAVELRAIGIRHDVSRHYRRAVTIADAQMVGAALIAQLSAVFDADERRQR